MASASIIDSVGRR